MDWKDLTGSICLYLSTALGSGTIGHNILLSCRIHEFGLSGSYLIYTLVSINLYELTHFCAQNIELRCATESCSKHASVCII